MEAFKKSKNAFGEGDYKKIYFKDHALGDSCVSSIQLSYFKF
jgi:hypothetical protein